MVRCRWLAPSLLVSGLLFSNVVSGQQAGAPDAATLTSARHLLRAMHAQENLLNSFSSGIARQRMQNASGGHTLPPVFYDSVIVRMQRSAPEIVDSIATVYARRFTSQQLEFMAQFFESPTGQAYAGQQSAIVQESTSLGQRFGVRIGAQVAKDLADGGVLFNQ